MKFPAIIFVLAFILQACELAADRREEASQDREFYGIDTPFFQYTGRFFVQDSSMRFAWSGSRIDLHFTGSAITVLLTPAPAQPVQTDTLGDYYNILLDGQEYTRRITEDDLINFSDLEDIEHTLSIFKRTEAMVAEGIFKGVVLDPGQKLLPPLPLAGKKIEFIGNSITCGYGNEGSSKDCHFSPETENAWLTYSHLTAHNLEAQYVSVCYSGKGIYQNYDQSKDQLMPELWRTYSPTIEENWHFEWKPDVVVVNLGTNDFAHGIPPKVEFIRAYREFLTEIIEQYPESKIVCLTGPMMTGGNLEVLQSYLKEIISLFSEERVFRFDLSSQGDLGLGCDWHPNVSQHKKNAQELTEFLSRLIFQ